MKTVKEPTYKKHVTGPIERFDDRLTGFSRGRIDPAGSKYDKMQPGSVENIRKNVKGKTVLDHGLWVAGRTVDYVMRRTQYGRETVAQFNREFKADGLSPEENTRIIKRVARWLGADLVGIARLNPFMGLQPLGRPERPLLRGRPGRRPDRDPGGVSVRDRAGPGDGL